MYFFFNNKILLFSLKKQNTSTSNDVMSYFIFINQILYQSNQIKQLTINK